LRYASPVMHFRRTASHDTELAGQKIRAGDKVLFWHISANRDETVFEEPMRFDIGRSPNNHVAFGGGGPHFCLGANLARSCGGSQTSRCPGRCPVSGRTSSTGSSTSR
jgi:cholest-4-en-3-one 26-monooxygenase